MTTNIFNEANRLKSYSITINDKELIRDTIISCDIAYKCDSPVVRGSILINDLYDLRTLINWEGATITVDFLDMFDQSYEKKFVLIDLKDLEHSAHRKAIELTIQDELSYKLDHSYISKSFNSTITNALNEYLTFLGFEEYSKEITDTPDTKYFTVPKNISNLQFFLNELKKYGYVFYQTRDGLFVKSQEDIDVGNLEEIGVYTNQTDNQLYMNIIHNIEILNANRDMLIPKVRSIAYDKDSKSINRYEFNDKSRYALNTNIADIQPTDGFKDIYQQDLNFGNHDRMVRESFLKQYTANIVVNGYNRNNVYQIYDLRLRGNFANVDSENIGNFEASGKYVSTKIIDKLVGDKMLQKIYLERADTTEKL